MKCITYLDKNNLYDWLMSGYLPNGRFKWSKNVWCLIFNFDPNSVSKSSSKGYILEFDLEYPNKLNELPNDYPLASEKLFNSLWPVLKLL